MSLKGRLGLETARVPHADRHGLMWLSRGHLYVEAGTLRFKAAGGGDLSAGDYGIPFQMVSCFLLQPGTTVSHDALRLMARHGTGLVAVGEDGVRLYASMPFGRDDSTRARRHASLWGSESTRTRVARRMYAWRLGEVLPTADIAVLRGIEGARARVTYSKLAEAFQIHWRGRRYDRSAPDGDDRPNQAINHAAAAVRAAALVAVAISGAIPQLGFIHEDSGHAFALDIADLYRDRITLPVAFGVAKHSAPDASLEREVRRVAGELIRKEQLVANMVEKIKELLDAPADGAEEGGASDGDDHLGDA